MLPATQSAREAARRAQCTNNIKQIVLAMHNYHSANNSFPSDITDKNGKPLLSWRVAILPYIEQDDLYSKFKLDEPWDSPHNKALLKEMPTTFLCPSRAKPEPFTTTYRGFVGAGACSRRARTSASPAITDGTSNTIAVVEAKEAVPWTKPDDLPFDPAGKPSLYGAGSLILVGSTRRSADGSVRFIKNTVSTIVFKALITRNGRRSHQPDRMMRFEASPGRMAGSTRPAAVPKNSWKGLASSWLRGTNRISVFISSGPAPRQRRLLESSAALFL